MLYEPDLEKEEDLKTLMEDLQLVEGTYRGLETFSIVTTRFCQALHDADLILFLGDDPM